MRYPALKSEYALETLEALRQGLPVDERRVLVLRGSGNDIEQVIPTITETLNEIRSKYPDQLRGKRDPAGSAFEAEACVELHKLLPFDAQMLGDHEWWTWMTVFHFRTLVDWRYPPLAAAANFGIGNRSENLLYRMWLRADVAYDAARGDKYELARRGDQDFWRSHVFRQGYGRCRSLVRALIRYQFPDGSNGNPTLQTDAIRELAKRLRRLHPNLIFEYLDEETAYKLVADEAKHAME